MLPIIPTIKIILKWVDGNTSTQFFIMRKLLSFLKFTSLSLSSPCRCCSKISKYRYTKRCAEIHENLGASYQFFKTPYQIILEIELIFVKYEAN